MDSQQGSHLLAIPNHKSEAEQQPKTELDFVFKRSLFWRPTYIAQSAWLEHIPFAFWLLETLRPRKVVELGTHYGSSYFSFCQAVTKLDLETLCFAVDTWGGDEHAGQYGEEVYGQVSEYNQQHYSGFSTLIRSTFDQALDHFPQGSIDLLHIDGLHTFEAVRHDFESWLPKLSEKAVVIMHDTNVRERGFGVFQLLDELKQQYPHFEFAHGHGLGVIGVGSEQSSEMKSLYGISENARATKQVHEIFSRLGKACGDSWENNQLKRQLTLQQEELQAEHQQLMEQQALERGRLAERITAQHHNLTTLESKLEHYKSLEGEQSAQRQEQLTTQEQAQKQLQQQLNEQALQLSEETQRTAQLTLALSKSNVALTEHSRQLTALQHHLEQALHTQDSQSRTMVERDNTVNLLQQRANALLQQLEDESQTKNQLQRAYGLLEVQYEALCKERDGLRQTNINLLEQVDVASVVRQQLQLQIDEQERVLESAHQRYEELTQVLTDKAQEASQWQMQCESLSVDLDASRLLLEQYETTKRIWQEQEQALNTTVEERFAEIAALTRMLEEQTQTISAQAAEYEHLSAQLHATQQQLQAEQAQHQISMQASAEFAAEQEKQVSELKKMLDERFNEIALLTRILEEQTRTIDVQAVEHERLNIQQQTFQQQAAQQQTQLDLRVEELVKHNDGLEANISERFRELAIMTNLIEQQGRELSNSEQQIERLKARINKLKGTVSWRLTAPVRALAKPFKVSPAYSISQINIIAESGYFDEVWYRQHYPAAGNNTSAIEHYLNIGAVNGYNPSSKFDTRWYINTYPDVANGDINPLLHFILHGQHEGRLCHSQS
ncbi:class I SAM-dependent methyltransferase [Buttiauxella sp.]|uniref:class I SAM-dependent methyltransferase n=1 Tax=Buttiauxella sp. TaxID=1972222 RepID=UPI003C730CC6